MSADDFDGYFVFADGALIGIVSAEARHERDLDRLRGIEYVPAAGGVLRNEGNGRLALTRIQRRLEHVEPEQGSLF